MDLLVLWYRWRWLTLFPSSVTSPAALPAPRISSFPLSSFCVARSSYIKVATRSAAVIKSVLRCILKWVAVMAAAVGGVFIQHF